MSIDPVALPLIDKEFVLPPGFEIFNGIRDAAPDKWGNYLLGKRFGRDLSPLEGALYNSSDRVGAMAFSNALTGPVSFTEHEVLPYTTHPHFNLETCVEVIDDIENNQDTAKLREYLQYGPSLGGARPKTTVRWKNELWLAKFSLSGDLKNEPLTEFASMSLAKHCGIDVPELDKTKVLGRDVFLIKRFDRKGSSPVHFISGLTATGIHESDYSRFDYGSLVMAIRRMSPDPNQDVEKLFRQLAFNVFINNSDDHLRNYGFLLNNEGQYALSPAYDITSILVSNRKSSLSLKFGDRGKEASPENLKSAYGYFGMEKSRSLEIIDEIEEKVSQWRTFYRSVGVSEEDIRKLEKSFEKI